MYPRIQMSEDTFHTYREDYIGICLECLNAQDCVEPDATNYTCEQCGANQVFGTEELMAMGAIDMKDDFLSDWEEWEEYDETI